MRNGRRHSRAPRSRRARLLAPPLAALATLMALGGAPAGGAVSRVARAGEAAPSGSATPFSYGLPASAAVPRWALARRGDVHFYPALAPAAAGASAPAAAGEPPGEEEAPAQDNGALGRRCGGCLGVPLRYYGGPVQHEPEVHVIFWGRNWNQPGAPGPELREQLLRFYQGLGDSPAGEAFQGILTQYFDGSGRVAPTLPAQRLSSFTDETVAAPANVGDAAIEHEARAVAENPANHWALGGDAQLVVVPAPGTTYEADFDQRFCAYHSVVHEAGAYWTYTFLSYDGEEPFEAGCLSYDGDQTAGHSEKAARVLSMDASHEYAESATDPTFSAWLDQEGNELADICSSGDDELANESWVQGLWDDHQSACSLEDTGPPHVLGLTEAASAVGQHEATLNATVNPENEGLETRYRFEYGPTTSYGRSAPAQGPLSAGDALGNQRVSEPVSGLPLETTYHYRLAASDTRAGHEETTYGEDHTFVPSLWFSSAVPPPPDAGQASFGSALISCSFVPWSCGGVSCQTSGSCVAVGSYELDAREVPMAESFREGRWSSQALPFPAQTGEQVALTGVSCASAAKCLAVGYERNTAGVRVPVADSSNGSEGWSVSPISPPAGAKEAGLEGVSCSTTSECMAVGLSLGGSGAERPYAALWRNGAWSAQSVKAPEAGDALLEGVSCPSAKSCVAVGFSETGAGVRAALSESWNGSGWSITSAKAPATAQSSAQSGVSCSAPGACMAVGSYTTSAGEASLTERWDGAKWSAQPAAVSGHPEELLGVSCPAAGVCTAVGDYEPGARAVAMVQTWNGTDWSMQASNVDEAEASELHAVSCLAGSTCAAAGITGWSAAGRSRSGFVEALTETRGAPLAPTPIVPLVPEPPPAPGPGPGPGPASTPGPRLVSPALGTGAAFEGRAAALRCRVPRLDGASLARARARLRRAHCALGRVRRPRRADAMLVVRRQSHSAGASLTAFAKVNVTLGTPPRARAGRR